MTFILKLLLLSRHRGKQNESDFTLFVLLPLNDLTVQIGLREPKIISWGYYDAPKTQQMPQANNTNHRASGSVLEC